MLYQRFVPSFILLLKKVPSREMVVELRSRRLTAGTELLAFKSILGSIFIVFGSVSGEKG